MKKRTLPKGLILGLCLVGILLVTPAFFLVYGASAKAEQFAPSPQIGGDEYCLGCHGQPDQTIELPNGELLYLTIDAEEYYQSVHGAAGYACVQCHTEYTSFPHPEMPAQTRREVTLYFYNTCQKCHPDKYAEGQDDVHAQALAAGNENAAVCSDCHGAHNVQDPDTPRTRIPETCERCHSEIYQLYANSVHGSALIGEGNPDVPTCTDCHGVHNVQGPANTDFRLYSPQICADCHADEELMQKYDISTDVFSTFVDDFHGTTLVLFDQKAEGQELDTPVCIDCHGVHNILPPTDPNSTVMKENLLATCQKCHPDATTNFPTAWMSHYVPSPEQYPLVYYVNLFYKFFIPGVLGGMAIFVVTDASRRIINRRKENKHDNGNVEHATEE